MSFNMAGLKLLIGTVLRVACAKFIFNQRKDKNEFLFLFLIALFTASVFDAFSQPNCQADPTGFTPINDLGKETFKNAWGETWTGGLYPGGNNNLPAAHKKAGMQMASGVIPLDSSGKIDKSDGKIVWLSIGMSNTTMEWRQFMESANSYENKNPALVLVDGAQGAMSSNVISSPWITEGNFNYNVYWKTVNDRLHQAGVTTGQVQVIWFLEADPAPMYHSEQEYYDSLVSEFRRIMHEIKVRFPNVKLCYLTSRISARYASTRLNPEPYSYYTGWAMKRLISDQINGDPELAYKGESAVSPWLSWALYSWSDGNIPQKSNQAVFWTCPDDFAKDGTHPSAAGARKVAGLLLSFYQKDTISCPWFFKKPPAFCPR